MDEGDALGLAARTEGAGRAAHGAGVGGVDTCHELDQRRFSSAVFAEKRVDLAGAHIKIDGVERPGSAEMLRQVPDLEKRTNAGRHGVRPQPPTPQSWRYFSL